MFFAHINLGEAKEKRAQLFEPLQAASFERA